jgi:dihydrofolate reductase
MRKLILEEWLTLDGFAADRDGELGFFPAVDTDHFSDRDQLAFLDGVDTIVLGRRTYELFVEFWPTATSDKEIIADRLNALPKLVFSNTLAAAPWGRWPAAKIVRGDAVAAVRELKRGDGKHLVLWGSLSLAQTLMAADLIDEYHFQLCPTILGGGRRLFPDLALPANLERKSVRTYDTGVVFLHYEPRRGSGGTRGSGETRAG